MLDGKSRQISIYNNRCHGEDTPFGELDVTDIEITHNKHDVNMINKNFLNVKITADMVPKTTISKTVNYKDYKTLEEINTDESACIQGDPTYANAVDYYIGWKNSSECITEMTVFNNGIETGYQQIFQDRDNYLENMKYMTKTEKDKAGRNCHLCYSNIFAGEKPGIILKKDDYLKHIQTETKVEYRIQKKLIDHKFMPLTSTAASTYGVTKDTWIGSVDEDKFKHVIHDLGAGTISEYVDVVLHYDFKVDSSGKYHSTASDGTDSQEHSNEAALISAIVTDTTRIPDVDDNPQTITIVSQRVYEAGSTPIEIPLIIPIKDMAAFRSMDEIEKQFGKITLRLMFGHRSMVYSEITDANTMTKLAQVGDGIKIENFRITELNCDCYGYNLASPEMLPTGDSPRIYEARYTDFKNYDGNMIDGKFHIEFPYPLTMVKDIHLTFPRKNYITTCFRNPMLNNVQLKIDGTLYPRNYAFDTTSMRFQHMQIDDLDIDDDVRYSYISDELIADNLKSNKYDVTNFLLTYNLSDGSFYGVNTERENVNIIFTASRKYKKNNIYGCDGSGNNNDDEPNPQIWFTRDAYWSLDTDNGLRFFNNRAPINSSSEIRYMK